MSDRQRVVIIGGGFAGLAAAKNLDAGRFAVTLLDRSNYHLFQPLLYQVATGSLDAPDIATPLRMILAPRGIRVVQEAVCGVDAERREVRTEGGRRYPWDILLLACGLGHSYFGNEQWAVNAPSLKFLEDAFEIRNRLLGAFEAAEVCSDSGARERLLRFVVVGGGPTGVELAGAIGELTGRALSREFTAFDPRSAEVLLVEHAPRLLPQYSQSCSDKAVEQLARLGVRVLTSSKVTDLDEFGVKVQNAAGTDTRFETANVIWAAGAAADAASSAIVQQLGIQSGPGGRVAVDQHFRVPGREDIFVIGDLADYRTGEERLPGLGPAAEQAGRYVGRFLSGRADVFRYRERGQLSVIGRTAAVGVVLGKEVSGPIAWWSWLLIHIFGLIGWDVKLKVTVMWAWKFLFDKYGARVITRRRSVPGTESPPS